jgi:trimeric autotransporter adhesin
MSTKTSTKRLALATVVAVGAGLLSVISVSSASAVTYDTYGSSNKISSSSTNAATSQANNLYMASYNSTTGTPYAATEGAAIQTNFPASFGLLSIGDVVGNDSPVVGLNQTATLLSTGKLSVYSKSGAAESDSIVVSGATLALGTASNMVINSTATAAQETAGSSGVVFGALITPNAGVSSFTVSLYTGNTAGIANATTGTLTGFITVSVGAGATVGTPSVTKSGVFYANYASILPSTWTYSTSSVTGAKNDSNQSTAGISAFSSLQEATIVEKDAYGTSLANTHFVTASATNGAYVGISAGAIPSGSAWGSNYAGPTSQVSGAAASFTVAASGRGYDYLVVSNPTTAALTTTVTVAIDGVVIATKAFTFTGNVTKVVLSTPSNGTLTYGGSTAVKFYDAAGNAIIPGVTTGYSNTITQDANTTGAGIGLGDTSHFSATTQVVGIKCGGTNISGNFAIDYTNADGSLVASNSVPFTCSQAPYTYTATLDKTTYNPGDIATLKVTFKDKLGALAGDYATVTKDGVYNPASVTQIASSTYVPNIYSANLTGTTGSTTTAGTATDYTTNGVATYKFVVGSTGGSYQLLVDFGYVDANGAGASLTVPYTITSSGTSLNDVLKAIVTLIASINKQIAALAAIVKKK